MAVVLALSLTSAACTSTPSSTSTTTTTTTRPSGTSTPSSSGARGGSVTGSFYAYPPLSRPTHPLASCLAQSATGLTNSQGAQIIREVEAVSPRQLQGVGSCPGGPVVIELVPGAEHLAHELLAQFGKNVTISVGYTSYDGTPGRSLKCGVLAAPSPLPVGLVLSLRLTRHTVPSGSEFDGTVIVTEQGPGSFRMDTGQPLQAVVVRTGTRQVVGVYSGGIAGTAFGPRLAPGDSSTIPVVGGTTRCDGGIGSALPTGSYQVIVRVAPEGSPQTPSYLTPPVMLTVTSS